MPSNLQFGYQYFPTNKNPPNKINQYFYPIIILINKLFSVNFGFTSEPAIFFYK